MFYNIFFELYSNYIFVPIFFLIGLFFQIDKKFSNEIDKIFGYDDDDETEEKKLYNFVMINDQNDFYKLENNNNIFIKKFFITNNQQGQNLQYEIALTLRENINYAVYFYLPIHFIYLDYYVKNNPSFYTLYKLNTKTNDIIIDAPSNDNKSVTKEIIKNNYTEIINILEYSGKYDKKNLKGWNNLYEEWIKPIEPSDKDNYLKLIQISFDKKEIEVENSDNIKNYEYTQIQCIRNFIQKDFFGYLKELYGDDESPFEKLSYSLTTYKINKSDGNIITILH
jgi:hypothetical protein